MLVWFMHGASVRRVEYADPLRSSLIEAFFDRGLASPEFYSCFWGDVLGNTHQLWDWVQQDLEAFKWEHPQIDTDDIFHYRQRREQLISGFFNDIFCYLNSNQGREVRRIIAVQFLNFLKEAPFEDDLHIVAHSLGSVILWDILFSDNFAPNDPAFYIRNVIKGLSEPGPGRKVRLRSITTLGSPLLFFNRVLNVDTQRLKQFASRYKGEPLRWINIIHASDIFAYPIRASLELEDSKLYMQDIYLGDRNFFKKSMGDVTMALGLVADHSGYWRRSRVARLVIANLLNETNLLEQSDLILEFGEED
ncbi:hypothetical protein K9N68_05270 [Kovacikia minuta CCNUW1]|uniref:hypothetical protein n=1 Tax=Kovacikia minuta TaxID=2931930 RepID=UPI001CCF16B7|nr:hypothetical protein [Kovacikia minuta]UBF27371.1 hypothetical protein K9N68_05270 [Kovacikia minuta CCNUW1]